MPTLNEHEIKQLAGTIQKDLSGTIFACSTLSRIPGGSASFTFRGDLISPLTLPHGTEASTVIVKKATEFAAINSDFELDSIRPNYENAMLKTLANKDLDPNAVNILVHTPRTLFYLASSRNQIFEDLQPALDCAALLTSDSAVSPHLDWSTIGFALGSWLHAFHNWTDEPAQHDLRTTLDLNSASQDLKWRTTYATIVDIASKFTNIMPEDVEVLKDVRGIYEQEHRKAMEIHLEVRPENYGLIHGDFWTGNTNFLIYPLFPPRLYIIDFEFTHIGHRVTDLGQMLGDLLEKSCVFRYRSSELLAYEMMIKGFVRGYGTVTEGLAYRIIIHAAVHVIDWRARHPNAELRDEVKRMMQKAVEAILRAWRHERAWVDDHVLGCLFVGSP